MNHVLHLLISLFCCGFWLPIWIILAITHNPRSDPWRCANCGQIIGTITPEQEHALVIQRAQAEAEQAHYDAEQQAVKAEQKAEVQQQRKENFAKLMESTIQQLKLMPGRVDFALRKIAGEENDIIYRFLQVSVVVVGAALGIGVLYLAFTVIRSLLT